MPFKSEAQRRKFREMLAKDEISLKTYMEWESKSPTKLPERVAQKQRTRKNAKRVKVIK